MQTEIAIRGGTLIDGSGAPGVRAALGIAGGRIVEIADRVAAEVYLLPRSRRPSASGWKRSPRALSSAEPVNQSPEEPSSDSPR